MEKYSQMSSADWGMNTDLHKALDLILTTALCNKVSKEEMPEMLVILSDMQFDRCVAHDDSALQMIKRKYEEAGYEFPEVTFWNLRAAANTPVKFNESGTALVSGFSPSTLKSVLSGKQVTPLDVMLETIMSERYSL